MNRLDHAELDPGDPLAAPLVHPGDLRDSVGAAVQRELEDPDEGGARLLQERDAVLAEVIPARILVVTHDALIALVGAVTYSIHGEMKPAAALVVGIPAVVGATHATDDAGDWPKKRRYRIFIRYGLA